MTGSAQGMHCELECGARRAPPSPPRASAPAVLAPSAPASAAAARACAAEFERERELARSEQDPVCAVHLIAIHGWLLWARGVQQDGPLGLVLPALVVLSLATLALQSPRTRPWYMRHRWAFAVAVRLGIQVAAPLLQRAWLLPAEWLAPHGALAQRAAGALALLSGSRSLILLNTAWVRPLAPAPQLALMLASFAIAAGQAGAACAGPALRAAAAADAVRSTCWIGDLLLSCAYGGVPPPQHRSRGAGGAGAAAAAGDLALCRRVAVFLQLLLGLLLPTALLLRREAAAAHAFLARRGLLPCTTGGRGRRAPLAYPLGFLERAHALFTSSAVSQWLHATAGAAVAWCAIDVLV